VCISTYLRGTLHLRDDVDTQVVAIQLLWPMLQCVAVCCSVLQCVAVCLHLRDDIDTQVVAIQLLWPVLQRVAVCCSVLQCVAVCCSVFAIERRS